MFIKKLAFLLLVVSMPAFSQVVRLQCNGSGSGTNIQGTKSFTFESFVEFNASTNYFNIDKLNDIAPGSKFPYEELTIGADVIYFKTRNDFMGGSGPTFGNLNRYNGQLTIEYLNAGNPAGMVTTTTKAVCTSLKQRQF
jgi:hypothetical protein